MKWLKKLLKRNLKRVSDKKLTELYYTTGCQFGDAVSYSYMGKCIGFDKLRESFLELEKEYCARGYVAITLDDFVRAGGYGANIEDKLFVSKSDEELSHRNF